LARPSLVAPHVPSLTRPAAPQTRSLGAAVTQLSFSPDGSFLAAGLANGAVRLLRIADESAQRAHRAGAEPKVCLRRAAQRSAAASAHPPPPQSLEDVASFQQSRAAVTRLAVAPGGQLVAAADAEGHVMLFRLQARELDPQRPPEWAYVGRHRAHFKPVARSVHRARAAAPPLTPLRSLQFGNAVVADVFEGGSAGVAREQPVSGSVSAAAADVDAALAPRPAPPLRLWSLGEDRVLHEFDLAGASIRGGLNIKSSTRVQQLHTPSTLLPLLSSQGRKQTLLVADDDGKLKVWQDGLSGWSCRKTVMAPPAAGAIRYLIAPNRLGKRASARARRWRSAHAGGAGVADEDDPQTTLFYAAADRTIGVIKLPLDGNPETSLSVLAHPGRIAAVASTFDGSLFLTAGGEDRTVLMWSFSKPAFDASIALSAQSPPLRIGSRLDPHLALSLAAGAKASDAFLRMLPGGRDGELYKTIERLFVYGQVRERGLLSSKPRQVGDRIGVEQVVDILRALGLFFTNQEAKNLLSEVRGARGCLVSPPAHTPQLYSQLRFKSFDFTGEITERITLEELIAVYVNHYPTKSIDMQGVERAFTALAGGASHGMVARDKLLALLENYGEKVGAPLAGTPIPLC
jgi:WD40 repeat protein